nr:chemotaxis protein CheW [Desulfobulbaceae bacterium]
MSGSDSEFTTENCWSNIGLFSRARSCELLAEYGHCRNCPTYSAFGRRMLDRPLTDEYRAELTAVYSQTKSTELKHTKSAFIFRAGEEWLGISSNLIKEVVDMGPIHSIPHKISRVFRGLVNIRGRLELCVSIGGVLRIEPGKKHYNFTSPERLIVAEKSGQSIVFPVSQVHGPHHYDQTDVKPLPVTVSGSKAVYTKCILRMPNIDVGILDDTLLFRILARNLS